ncbi:hypothetical protein Tco_0499844, partial [Tanacetum coccineum]
EEEYHSIIDDTPLVSVYTIRKVTVKGMLIPDNLITDEIQYTQEYKDYVEEFRRQKPIFTTPIPPLIKEKILEENVEKMVEGEDEESYASEFVDSVFLNEDDSGGKKDDKKDDDDDDDEDDDHDDHVLIRIQRLGSSKELMATVSPTPATSSQGHAKLISKKYSHIPVIDPELWDVLKCKFEKSYALSYPCRIDAFRKRDHEDHQEDDAPHEGEKRAKKKKTSKGSKSASDETTKLIEEFHNVDKHVPTIFDQERIEATLRDMMSNQFKDVEEYAYHLEKSNPKRNLNEPPRIVEVFRVTTEQQHRLDYMEQIIMMRENNKPNSFSKPDIKYLNKNDIEDMYFLCLNKKVNYCEKKLLNSLMTFIRSHVTWERIHDFHLGIESYQIMINLTAPTLIFTGIEACDPYFIIDKPTTCLIYLNGKEEERVMNLVAIVKFCDATQERVLKEVKLKIFETEFLKKAPLLGELYLDIMKAYEREITVRIIRLLDDLRVTAAQMCVTTASTKIMKIMLSS